jgi:hypothetical protein
MYILPDNLGLLLDTRVSNTWNDPNPYTFWICYYTWYTGTYRDLGHCVWWMLPLTVLLDGDYFILLSRCCIHWSYLLDLKQATNDQLIWTVVVLTHVGKCRKRSNKRKITVESLWKSCFLCQ